MMAPATVLLLLLLLLLVLPTASVAGLRGAQHPLPTAAPNMTTSTASSSSTSSSGGGGDQAAGDSESMLLPRPTVGNCTVHLGAKPAQPIKMFRWLHIPKAGSSFATTLYHYACPLLPKDAVPQAPQAASHGRAVYAFENVYPFFDYCNMGNIRWYGPRQGHPPLKNPREIPLLVLMVRDPRRRLWSAYNNDRHATGMSIKEKTRLRREAKTLDQYIHFPGIQGCQVKMMNKRACNAQVNVTDAMLNVAINAIRKAAFVGDTDEWDDSICLFHAMFGGEINPHSFSNIRPTLTAQYNRTELILKPEDDPYDWQFYLAAKAVMRRNQQQYGLPTYIPPPTNPR